MGYFPQLAHSKNEINIDLNMSSCAKKSRLKKFNWIWYKADLASLKASNDKLDTGKLKTSPADLIKLSKVVENNVVKKTVLNDLVKKLMLLRLVI